jgi:hypothetical protein
MGAGIKAALYSELTEDEGIQALVGTRVYPFAAPAGTAKSGSWITYLRANSEHEQHLGGNAGLAQQTIYIDCWSTSDSIRLEQLSETVRRLLNGRVNGTLGHDDYAISVNPIRLLSQQDEVIEIEDAEPRVRFHTRMTFEITHAED